MPLLHQWPAAMIVGCGDIGLRVARSLPPGLRTYGVVRRAEAAEGLRRAGIEPLIMDLDESVPPVPPACRLVFWFAPPPSSGSVDTRLRRFLAARPPIDRLVYISTSGVYGDCGGRWIDEDEPLKPQTDRGRRRLDAESALQEWALSSPSSTGVVILRVPGIYGPGRLPLDRLRRGLPVVRPDECPYSNRIHADDLATAALAAAERGASGCAYNIADGHPTTMSDYFIRCARLLGLPEPPQVSMEEARTRLTPAMLSFLDESKRLDNRRLRETLGVQLRYPSIESGLPSCLEGVS